MTDNIYALINNGAYGQAGALEDISREVLEKQFQSNVFGWHELTNLILPRMRDKNDGRIVYISSVLGFVAMPFRGPYVCLLYTSPSPRDGLLSRMPSSA